MWGEFLSAEESALAFFARLPDLLWGALLGVLCVLAARAVFRAALRSLFGEEEGSVLAALAEVAAAFLVGLRLHEQPGAVFMLLGYFAALARVLAPNL